MGDIVSGSIWDMWTKIPEYFLHLNFSISFEELQVNHNLLQ